MENKTWLIVGLGNPGVQYAMTRHNIGFLALDLFAKSYVQTPGAEPRWNEEHRAHVCKLKLDGTPVILAKPMTYMNLSGESVQPLMNFYKVSMENLIVVHDEIDQPFKAMKIQKNRGHGGHNGIRSITDTLGSMDYLRLRLGVGRPENPKMNVADYVLQKFNDMEQAELPDFLNVAGDALESLMFEGLSKASTKYNK